MIKALLRASASIVLFLSCVTVNAENPNFETSHFSGSGNCAQCHDRLTDSTGENVSIVKDWGPTMMANSTKDPFWQAKVASELERNAHLAPLINDVCTKCHAPMASVEIIDVQGGELTLFGPDGILNPDHPFHDAAMNGVSCTVCHQIMDDGNLGILAGFSGNYTINDDKLAYGQYRDVRLNPMQFTSGYTPTFGAHVSDSATCAVCHNLKTPFVDADGDLASTTPESEFPEQMPYTEWENSEFDDAGSNPQSCQDCHMPETTARLSNRPRSLAAKDGFGKHHLVGGNTTMLALLRDNAAQLGVTSPDMDLAIDRTRALLQSSMTVEILSASVTDGVLEARVKLQNESGHKTPTAYPSRRMWIHLKVSDSSNNVIFESGKVNADGSIDGADADTDQTVYEPHYELITSADQVQIYESVIGNTDGNVTYTLLRAAGYLKDNRITPRGFDKLNVPDDVAVRGLAFNDADFNLGSDEITYRFPVAIAGDLNITVELNYQAIAHDYVQDLYRDSQLEQVQTFKTMYDAQSLKHEQIASTQTTVVSDGGAAPQVHGFWPGTASTGEQVHIFGLNFDQSQTQVSFNVVPASGLFVVDTTHIVAIVPSGNVTGPITVTTPQGSDVSATDFGVTSADVTIDGFWPSSGLPGSLIHVFGDNFDPASSAVDFAGVPAGGVYVVDPTHLVVITPGGASTGPITVTTPAGGATTADNFIVLN